MWSYFVTGRWRITSILLAAAILVSGCGGGGGTSSPAGSSAATHTTALGTTALPAPTTTLQSASAASGVPGTIVRLNASTTAATSAPQWAGRAQAPTIPSDTRIQFGSLSMPPVAIGPDFVTVMVPPIPPGDYTLSLSSATAATNGSVTFSVLASPDVDPNTTAKFVQNVGTLATFATGYTHDAFRAMGTSDADSAQLDAAFQNVSSAMTDIQTRLASLNPDELKLLGQLLAASGLHQQVQEAVRALRPGASVQDARSFLTRFHLQLPSAPLPLQSALMFATLTKLDVANAVLDDMSTVLTVVEAGSLLAAVSGVGAGLSAATIATLEEIKDDIGLLSHLIHGAIPTDLKAVRIAISPDQGHLLNPGETATVHAYGVFGTQSTPAKYRRKNNFRV